MRELSTVELNQIGAGVYVDPHIQLAQGLADLSVWVLGRMSGKEVGPLPLQPMTNIIEGTMNIMMPVKVPAPGVHLCS